MSANISSYCIIRNGQIQLNGELIYENAEAYDEFIKAAYRTEKLAYPKFFKMDRLSKLAFVTASLMIRKDALLENYSPDKIGIYLSNKASSLDTDRQHQVSINDPENYFPSPAVFVYTLPNIAIGEIAIKHQIKGPNNFFIFDKFDASFYASYITDQLSLNKIDSGLFGWVDVDGDNYEAALFFAEKGEGTFPLNENTLIDLYNR